MGFESIDVLAPVVGLTVRKQCSYKTILGAVLSLIGFLVVLAYLVISLIDCFSGNVKSVTTVTSINPDHVSYDLLLNKNLPVIMVATPSAYLSKDDVTKYVTLKLDIAFNEAAGQAYTKTTVDFAPCSTLRDSGKYDHIKISDSVANERIFRDGYCVDPKDKAIVASGRGYEVGSKLATVRIMPCSLASGCITATEVPSMYVFVAKIEAVVDYNDRANPVSYRLATDSMLSVTTAVGQYYTERIMQGTIKDFGGFPMKDTTVSTYTISEKVLLNNWERDGSTSCTAADVDTPACLEYLTWDIISGTNVLTVTRHYSSIITVLAEFGGIKSAVFLVLYWFYIGINNALLGDYMVRAVYNLRRRTRGIGYFLTCCKRRSDSDGNTGETSDSDGVVYATDSAVDHATRVISRSLDAASIVRDICALKFIIHFLMTEYQRNLAPIAALNADINIEKSKNGNLPKKNLEEISEQQIITNSDAFEEQSEASRAQGGRKETQKVSYETLMKHVFKERIAQMSADDMAGHQYKKEICLDMDRLFNEILGSNSYLPFNDGRAVISSRSPKNVGEIQDFELNGGGSSVNRKSITKAPPASGGNKVSPSDKGSKHILDNGSNYEKDSLNQKENDTRNANSHQNESRR